MITIVCFFIQANQAYFGLHQAFSQAKAYYTVLVTQIKSQEGYREDMPIAFVGEAYDRTYPSLPEYSKFKTMAGIDYMSYYYQIYSKKELIKYCCGFAPEYIYDTASIEKTEEYKKMPCYPDSGSIAILNETVVVKFAEP